MMWVMRLASIHNLHAQKTVCLLHNTILGSIKYVRPMSEDWWVHPYKRVWGFRRNSSVPN